jgi:hypothetical protein
MLRIIAFIAAAVVALLVVGWLVTAFLHTLVLAFWIVVVILIGFGLFRVSRWSSRRTR